jgi:hypothetical protein
VVSLVGFRYLDIGNISLMKDPHLQTAELAWVWGGHIIFSVLTLYLYNRASTADPGYLPHNSRPVVWPVLI